MDCAADSVAWVPCLSGTYSAESCGSGNPIAEKLVTVVVRRSGDGDWVREQSTFTAATGS